MYCVEGGVRWPAVARQAAGWGLWVRSSRPQDRRRANAREPVRSCTG